MVALQYAEAATKSPANAAGILDIRATSLAKPPKREHDTKSLIVLARQLETLLEVATSLGNHRRFSDRDGVLNDVGSEFDDITDSICEHYSDAMVRLRDSSPTSRADIKARRIALLKYDLGCDDDVTERALASMGSSR